MSAHTATADAVSTVRGEPTVVRWLLIGAALVFLALFLVLPLVAVFAQAFRGGLGTFAALWDDEAARAAVRLTLLVAAISVPFSVLFGLAAAWCLACFRFRGRGVVVALIDLPFTVSPVVVGLSFVLLFGAGSELGQWLSARDISVVFALPGIALATIFVTLPFVARELLPAMEAQGHEEELAAVTLGANAWTIFSRVTLPRIKWPLAYGVILANARAMGEFGAVSVVSGLIRGRTCTMPLYVEILYNEYAFTAAFAMASLLALLALVTLLLQAVAGRRAARILRESLQ